MPAEAQSLEAAALSRVEAQPIAHVPIGAPIAPAPQPLARRARPRIDLRRPESLRAAVIAHTVIGPCRAAQPYQAGPDV
jgi:hypothetical protein